MFLKAFGIAEMLNMDKESRIEYEGSLKAYLDLKVILDESFDKGKLEGELEKAKSYIKKLLEKKIGNIPENLKIKINNCNDISIIDKISDNIFDFNSIEEVYNLLDN